MADNIANNYIGYRLEIDQKGLADAQRVLSEIRQTQLGEQKQPAHNPKADSELEARRSQVKSEKNERRRKQELEDSKRKSSKDQYRQDILDELAERNDASKRGELGIDQAGREQAGRTREQVKLHQTAQNKQPAINPEADEELKEAQKRRKAEKELRENPPPPPPAPPPKATPADPKKIAAHKKQVAEENKKKSKEDIFTSCDSESEKKKKNTNQEGKSSTKKPSTPKKGLPAAGKGFGKEIGHGFSSFLKGGNTLGAMKGLGAIGALGFLAGVGAGLAAIIAKVSAEKAIEKDTALFKRDRLNKQGGNGTGWDAKQMDAMAKQMVETGVFTEVAAIKAQSLALAFRNIKGDQFKKVLELSADVAVVMGKDLPAATQELSAALDDPVKAAEGGLEHLGIQFSLLEQSAIKSRVATRDYAGAQELILAQVEKFRGAAGEFAKRPEGQWKQIIAKVEMLAAKIGNLLIPIILKVTNFFVDLADIANNAFDNIDTVWEITKALLDVGFKELLLSSSSIFQRMLISFRAAMAAMATTAKWAWDKIKFNLGEGADPGELGNSISKAYKDKVKELEDTLKNGTAKEWANINALAAKLHKDKEKNKEEREALLAKPKGKPSDYVNTRAKFQFETTGFAEMSKKIQSQILPGSMESMMGIQVQLNQQQVALAKENIDVNKKVLGVMIDKAKPGPGNFA